MAKVKPGASSRKGSTDEGSDPHEAFDELCRVLKKHWPAPPEEIVIALQDLALALGEPSEDDYQNSPTPGAIKADALSTGTDLSSDLRRPRHDEKKVPAGYIFQHGALMRKITVMQPSQRADAIARSLLWSLACLFNVRDKDGREIQLISAIRLLIIKATPGGTMIAEREDRIERAWEAYAGKPWEHPRWADDLEAQLRMNAEHREERRLREVLNEPEPVDLVPHLTAEIEADGTSGPLFGVATGEQILQRLRHHFPDLPEELTASTIDAMIERVGLNAGGRKGGKTPRKVVDSFLSELARRARLS
jgi:hypothetical protein